MNKFRAVRPMSAVSMVASLMCFIAPCPVRAVEGVVTAPIDVSASLDTKPTITLGEPVVLRYNVSNIFSQKIGVRWGEDGAAWYSLHLADSQGVSVATIPLKPVQQPAGAFAVDNPFISVGNSFPGYLVVTRLFKITHPGKYTLTMRVNLPYAVVAVTEESPVALDKLIDTDGSVLSEVKTVSFTVTDANPAQLTASAEALRHEISRTLDATRLSSLLDSLFSMPADAAFASWQSLADNPKMNAALLADELASVHSEGAADILAEMYDNSSLTRDDRDAIGQRLNELYNDGDADLRTHIEQIAMKRGFVLPDKVVIPQVTD